MNKPSVTLPEGTYTLEDLPSADEFWELAPRNNLFFWMVANFLLETSEARDIISSQKGKEQALKYRDFSRLGLARVVHEKVKFILEGVSFSGHSKKIKKRKKGRAARRKHAQKS